MKKDLGEAYTLRMETACMVENTSLHFLSS